MIDTVFTDGGPFHIRMFDVDIDGGGKVSNGKALPTGSLLASPMACDATSNLLGKIHIPETVANLTFGRFPAQSALYLREHHALCVLRRDTQGALTTFRRKIPITHSAGE